ncbi:MAG: cytochrome c oxidase subunit II [Chloroflexi bacterium]|nr:MAG: cytochrome c oxidase subunit II [Chloroflexota bacterium]
MPPLWPQQASTIATSVDTLMVFMLALACLFASTVSVLLVVFSIRYRRRRPDEVPQQTKGSNKLEIAWMIIPFVLSMIVFFWGANLYFQMSRPPDDSMEVYVIGRQWMWKFVHASGQEEINELHVPINQNIKLTMTSQDVIHDVFVPAFRVKDDVLPERYTTAWFNATTPGQYHLFCSQYCGTDHAEMVAWVYALTPADFQKWQGALIPVTGGPETAGAQLFQSLGCGTCHHTDNSGAGPTLLGIFGLRVNLADGSSASADENYVVESIINPNAKIVAGYQPVMPTFQGRVSAGQMLQLITYIKSLSAIQPVSTSPRTGIVPASAPN